MSEREQGVEEALKALKDGGASPYQGYEWPLPEKHGDGWEPGEWVGPVEGALEECANGLHACRLDQLPRWLSDELYVLEPRDGTDVVEGEDKIVVREARLTRRVETWTETTARLYAADCAEMVLPLYEDEHPDDDRPREAIEAARAYALGEIGDDARSAARSAAVSAARSAAVSAAGSAAGSAAVSAAVSAAESAAVSAARSVAGYAAVSAAWDAVRSADVSDVSAAWDALTDRLRLYLERGEGARHEPLPDIDEIIEEADDE